MVPSDNFCHCCYGNEPRSCFLLENRGRMELRCFHRKITVLRYNPFRRTYLMEGGRGAQFVLVDTSSKYTVRYKALSSLE